MGFSSNSCRPCPFLGLGLCSLAFCFKGFAGADPTEASKWEWSTFGLGCHCGKNKLHNIRWNRQNWGSILNVFHF